jgi:hypothetical protein
MVRNRQVVQQSFTFLGELKENLAVIFFRWHSFHGVVICQPVYQLHGAVMADQHPRGELADSGLYSVRQTFDGQQKLVLLRFDSAGARLVFAEP